MKCCKENISVIRYVLHILYPKQNSYLLFIYIVVKYIIDTKRCQKYKEKNVHKIGLISKVIPRKIIKKIVNDKLTDPPYDTWHQIVVPHYYFDELYAENIYFRDEQSLWMTMRITLKNEIFPWLKTDKSRVSQIEKFTNNNNKSPYMKKKDKLHGIDKNEIIVQIVPSHNIEENVAYMNENVYFNLTKSYKARLVSDIDLRIHLYPINNIILAPQIADIAVIEMVNTPLTIGTDLVYILLEKYFSVPKFLHENDCFGIPLTEKYMKHLYFKYFDVANEIKILYFICKKLNNKKVVHYEMMRGKINTSIGYFVVKGITEMIQEHNTNSYIPQNKLIDVKVLNLSLYDKIIDYPYINTCPYGLESSFMEIEKSIKPFLLEQEVNPFHVNLKCTMQPLFLLRGEKGCGRSLMVSILAEQNGMHFFSKNCRQLAASTAKQTEVKLDALIQRAKSCAPVIVYLEDFEVFAIDGENNENVRVIESFLIKLKVLFENFTKKPIIIIAGCDINAELKPNLARIFLDQIIVNNLKSNDRLLILKWIILLKSIYLCDEEFQPILFNAPVKDPDIISIEDSENSSDEQINEAIDHIGNYSISNATSISDCRTWNFNKECETVLEKIASQMETLLYDDIDSLMHLVLRNSYLSHEKYLIELPGTSIDDRKIKPKVGLVRECDFDNALETLRSMYSKKLTPLKVPNVNWDDIGGLEELKKEIFRTIELPLKFPHLLANSGLKRSGILLWGPPGCGKTLVARAVASQLQANFLSVKGPELLDMYVGQSEKNMREIFAAARSSAPCVIFFDEAEAAAGARGASGDSGGAADRLVSQLLAELDGVAALETDSQTGSVVVVAATNRPDLVEPALLRPGRLDKLLYVGPYDGQNNKVRVLKASAHGCNLDESVDLCAIADELPNKCTGADLAAIVKRARHLALKTIIERAEAGELNASELSEKDIVIKQCDFQNALIDFNPSISEDEMNYYESLKDKLS